MQNKAYTITDFQFNYKMPAILVDPARCQLTITHEVSPSQGSDAVQFNVDSLTFTFFNVNDVSIAGGKSETYDVTVTATSGQASKTFTFQLTLKNPCVDPNFIEF